jgi:hypothetical protein
VANELVPIDEKQVPDVLKEIEEAFFDIPFENSAFQNKAFVVAAQITPARAYRTIGLRLLSKIQTLKENRYRQELKQVDIDEKEEKLRSGDLDQFARRRLEIELRQLKEGGMYETKLLNDLLVDLNQMYAEFKKLPKYTREQFEAEEMIHFQQRLQRQLTAGGGAQESIINMTEDMYQLPARIQQSIARLECEDTMKRLAVY